MLIRPEWDSQEGVLLTWPHAYSSWRDSLDEIGQCYENLAWQISRFQPVHILCYDKYLRDSVHRRLRKIGISEHSLHFYIIKTNDTWIRDYGPLRLCSSEGSEFVSFQFNAWGEKYSFDLDNAATKRLMQHAPFSAKPYRPIDFVLEGGAIDVNGYGSLLTTRSCLLNINRNNHLSKSQIESMLITTLGINNIIWIDSDNLAGDDTDGHIDTLARFCNDSTIIYNDADSNKKHTLRGSLRSNNEKLTNPLELVACPMPKLSKTLPASYVNFLIINDAVLVPTYQDAADKEALAIFDQLFPDRKIVGIDCKPLIQQYGSLHCATMQF